MFCPQWHTAITKITSLYTQIMSSFYEPVFQGLKTHTFISLPWVTPSWAFVCNLAFPMVFTHPSCFQIIAASFPVPLTFIYPSNSCLFKFIPTNHIFPQKSKRMCDALLGSSVLVIFKTPSLKYFLSVICCYRIHTVLKQHIWPCKTQLPNY